MLPIQVPAHLLKVLCLLENLVNKRARLKRRTSSDQGKLRVVKKFRISKKDKSPKTTSKRGKSQKCDDDSDASSALMDIDHLLDSTPVQHKGTFREEYEKIHRRYGHVDINRLVYLKRKGIVHSSLIPTSTKIKCLVKDCPVCLAMKYCHMSSLADAHADWNEWKSLMQSAMHSVVLGHILADANMDFTAADLLSAWIYQPKPRHFYLPGYPIPCIASLHVHMRKDTSKIVRVVFFTRRSKHHFGAAFATILANLMLSVSISAVLCLLPMSARLRMVIKWLIMLVTIVIHILPVSISCLKRNMLKPRHSMPCV